MIIYACEIIFLNQPKRLIDDSLNDLLDRVKSLLRRDTKAMIIDIVEIEKTDYSFNFEYLAKIRDFVNESFSFNPYF